MNFKNFYKLLLEESTESVAALLKNNDGKILILLRGETAPWMPNKWALPGGSIDLGETAIQSIERECIEEIGIIPKKLSFIKTIKYPDYKLSLFTGIITDTPILNYEHTKFAFVDKKNINEYSFVPNLKNLLLQFI